MISLVFSHLFSTLSECIAVFSFPIDVSGFTSVDTFSVGDFKGSTLDAQDFSEGVASGFGVEGAADLRGATFGRTCTRARRMVRINE